MKKQSEKQNTAQTARPETKRENPACIPVVIPYRRELAQGNELLYAVRSWCENARFPHRIFIIGDREEWMDTENITVIECPKVSDIPTVDLVNKIWTAVNCKEITDRFIWTADDIYVMNPIGLAHIEIPKTTGKMNPHTRSGWKKESMEKTVEILADTGLPTLDYDTHTPVLFDKKKLMESLPHNDHKAQAALMFVSVYFNAHSRVHPARLDWMTDSFLLPVVTKTPDEKKVEKLIGEKVFMHNAESGYSAWLESYLGRNFPEKCRCEL